MTLALFNEIQALGWLNFVIGADLLWLSPSRYNNPKIGWFISIFYTSTLHLPLAHESSLISESIHISPLITTIKKNKIVSLLFNVGLNIFTNLSSSIFTLTSLHLCCNIYSFNWLLLKCSNNPLLILILKFFS